MAVEIERKFRVADEGWRTDEHGAARQGVRFRQGYVPGNEAATVRVRLEGERGVLTIKARSEGLARLEFEYTIPAADALEMLDKVCSQPQIDKIRYRIAVGEHVWEVDEFLGDNAGLVVAEIELDAENEQFTLPTWIGKEVTEDVRYLNVNLARHPFKDWS